MAALPKGWTEHRFESLGSTMDAARDMAEAGAGDGTLIRADSQTGGRGRQGRVWTSPPGNLYMTAIVRETRPLAECAHLSFAAALALADSLDHPAVTLKWPNDVLIHGAKTAGILLEAGGDSATPWILLGIGVNIVSHPADTPYPATDLKSVGTSKDADSICVALVEAFARWRGVWRKEGARALHGPWLERAHGRGGPITVRSKTQTLQGKFEGMDEEGRLIVVEDTGARHAIAAGDVFF